MADRENDAPKLFHYCLEQAKHAQTQAIEAASPEQRTQCLSVAERWLALAQQVRKNPPLQ
jgi:hypothetical protein